jgi:hypothetical protein
LDRPWKPLLALFKESNPGEVIRKIAIGAISAGILFFVVNIGLLLMQNHRAPDPPQSAPKEAVAKSNPFTLQVAAYLHRGDAEQYIQKLKQQNLNAYLTEAQGHSKKWYQVRISHFADSAEAKKYGESLKSKGLINDYYVANYELSLNDP